jgi:arylsulfatase A-like enzyme
MKINDSRKKSYCKQLLEKPLYGFGLVLSGLLFGNIAPTPECSAGNLPDKEAKPNIVFILADDLGYGSINSYGAINDVLRTPNINSIAENGMRFTDASTPASICSPTRYGLITGRYPWRSELKSGVVDPKGEFLPDPDRLTVADWLKERNYNTAAVGKWHLGYGEGPDVDFTGKLSPGPLDIGFDYHFAVPQNHGDMHGVYIKNDHIYGLRSEKKQPYSRTYYGPQYIGYDAPQRVNKDVMEVITDKAVDWLRSQSKNNPFFMYFAPVAVHRPITPSDDMRHVSSCGPYGDFIQDLDMSVGRILEILKHKNLTENTLVIFTSDNGGVIPSSEDLNIPENYAVDQGLKINGELRGRKHTIWEGGTRVPFIVSWPGKVEPGTKSDAMINIVDFFATICDITDGKLPADKKVAPDSYSFLHVLLQNENNYKRESMVTANARGYHAIRRGNYKYIDPVPPHEWSNTPKPNRVGSMEPHLFNLKKDLDERKDIYDENPEIVKELKQELNQIRKAQSSR